MLPSCRKWPAMAATGSIPAEMVSVVDPVSKWDIKVKSLDSRCTFVNEIIGISVVRQRLPPVPGFPRGSERTSPASTISPFVRSDTRMALA